MLTRRLPLFSALAISILASPSLAQEGWRSPGFKFPQPVQLVAEIPVKETGRDPSTSEGLPPPARPAIGIIGVINERITRAMEVGTELGSTTTSAGQRLACVVAESKKDAQAVIRATIDSPLGMRGYRVQGSTIEFRAGFESRPRIRYQGNLPSACRQRFQEEAEKDLDRLLAELDTPAGAIPVAEIFDKAEKGIPGSLPVTLTFLGSETTVDLTFPMPRPFGQ